MRPEAASTHSRSANPARERLIVALDVPTIAEAASLVSEPGDAVHFYEVGLELFLADGFFPFVDEPPATEEGRCRPQALRHSTRVQKAVAQLAKRGLSFTTVHGNDNMLRAACEVKEELKVLAVTGLTSLDRGDMEDLGFEADIEQAGGRAVPGEIVQILTTQ